MDLYLETRVAGVQRPQEPRRFDGSHKRRRSALVMVMMMMKMMMVMVMMLRIMMMVMLVLMLIRAAAGGIARIAESHAALGSPEKALQPWEELVNALPRGVLGSIIKEGETMDLASDKDKKLLVNVSSHILHALGKKKSKMDKTGMASNKADTSNLNQTISDFQYLGGEGNAASKHAPLGPELSRRRGKLKLLHFRRASPTASPMRNTMNSTMGDALGKGEPASKAS
ncbi:hypothetical protein AK812_SmicGene21622 [Symbiodinium microadriaticum]|uniref:Uncharacterized protein n=1 Tax=Symbiodinium microadriaticum TaxID=2951 RepID=A0A1Q9DLW4_SYMMI|nr:hypothetical protein AK812_SmicGene21622 [Symbiodinium microadriaticum]